MHTCKHTHNHANPLPPWELTQGHTHTHARTSLCCAHPHRMRLAPSIWPLSSVMARSASDCFVNVTNPKLLDRRVCWSHITRASLRARVRVHVRECACARMSVCACYVFVRVNECVHVCVQAHSSMGHSHHMHHRHMAWRNIMEWACSHVQLLRATGALASTGSLTRWGDPGLSRAILTRRSGSAQRYCTAACHQCLGTGRPQTPGVVVVVGVCVGGARGRVGDRVQRVHMEESTRGRACGTDAAAHGALEWPWVRAHLVVWRGLGVARAVLRPLLLWRDERIVYA